MIAIDASRITRDLETLAKFSTAPPPAVSRIVFSPEDLGARSWLKTLCLAAGLEVREDAVGNTFARWQGSDASAPAVATGSHIDAIPNAGRYDGTVGVLGGLEAIRALQESGLRPKRSIDLILFTSEEPTRFGIGCLGSRLLSGSLDPSAGANLRDGDGRSLDVIRNEAGFQGNLDAVALPHDYYSAFVELHIEQGALLERRSVPLGVVTAIAAPASLRIEINGEGGHAGAVLMPDRHDAFLAAAELALQLESAALSTGSIDSVATTGICRVFPGAVNSIPSSTYLEVDVRDIDLARRDSMLRKLERACETIALRRGVYITPEEINRDAPAACDPGVVATLAESCAALGFHFDRMVSRAYHDSLFMSRICPAAMLFIPCRAGISHRPDEYASEEDIARGALVLAETLGKLAEAQ